MPDTTSNPNAQKNDTGFKIITWPGVVVVVIFGLGLWGLWHVSGDATPVRTRTRIEAARNLSAYSLISAKDLVPRAGNADSPDAKLPTLADFDNRILLVSVKSGEEVKLEMLAPATAAAKTLLSRAVEITVPADSLSVAGPLPVGEFVDVVPTVEKPSAVPRRPASTPKVIFDGLMVLRVSTKSAKADAKEVPEITSITFAVPVTKLDDFADAAAVSGAKLFVTRQIPTTN